MIESLTDFHEMRSNPQIMIKGKATPFFFKKKGGEFPDASAENAQKGSARMSDEELRVLEELKLRDSAVREEEEKHARMLGRHAGAIRYEYQIGPDGRPYVINGSVEVDPKFNSSDSEDIRKILQQIRRAAVSVSNPSQADLNIAASAATKISITDQKAAIESYTQSVEIQSRPTIASSPATVSDQLNAQA